MRNKKRIRYTAIPRKKDLSDEIKRHLQSEHHEDDKMKKYQQPKQPKLPKQPKQPEDLEQHKEPDIVDLSACAEYAVADINDIYISSVDDIDTIYFANKNKSKVLDLATSRLYAIEDKIPLTDVIFDHNLNNDILFVLRKFFHITRSVGYISKYDYEDSSYNNSKYLLSDFVEMAVSIKSSNACKDF